MAATTSKEDPSGHHASADWRGLLRQLPSPLSGSLAQTDDIEPIFDLTGYVEKGEIVGMGTYGDVYQGRWTNLPGSLQNLKCLPEIAIKVMRISFPRSEQEQIKRLRNLKRELKVWRSLDHENILGFVGVAHFTNSSQPWLLSMWMPKGTVKDYIEDNPDASRFSIIYGIAKGLVYLHYHDPEVIHGDLKADNVLIDQDGTPCLCDFGLSRMVEDTTLWATSASSAGGTVRWKSPELMNGEQATVTTASDVYAFAMTSLEIITGNVPFPHYRNEAAVITAVVLKNEIPGRPMLIYINDPLWELLKECWKSKPHTRPSMREILRRLQSHWEYEDRLPLIEGSQRVSRTGTNGFQIAAATVSQDETEALERCTVCMCLLISDSYRCASCEKFELCPACYSQAHDIHPVHAFFVVSANAEATPALLSHGLRCCACDKLIFGILYHCAVCPCYPTFYTLCSDCEPLSHIHHDPMHVFLKIDRPLDYPIMSRTGLLPAMYINPVGLMPDQSQDRRNPPEYLNFVDHPRTLCDMCMRPIHGKWFHCLYCDRDLCQDHGEIDTHDPTHLFLIFKSPVDFVIYWEWKGRGEYTPTISHPVYKPLR